MRREKAILMSIKPKYVAKILNGEKIIEIRKTAPKCDLPIDVYIYCTKGKKYEFLTKATAEKFVVGGLFCAQSPRNGKVVAKFTLKKVESIYWKQDCIDNPEIKDEYILATDSLNDYELEKKSCLKKNKLEDYIGYELNDIGYAYYISDLIIFDKPKKLDDFEKAGSYNNPTVKCKKKARGECNHGISEFTGKWVGCDKARLTKAPQSWCYIERV